MERLLFLCCLLCGAASAFFFPLMSLPGDQRRQSVMNVCIYSRNPAVYRPRCFLCPSSVYSNVLRACVNEASIPSNVSYTQAACIEQNCAIGRGKRSLADVVTLKDDQEGTQEFFVSEDDEDTLYDDDPKTGA